MQCIQQQYRPENTHGTDSTQPGGYKGGIYTGDWAGNGAGGRYTEYGRFMGTDGLDWCAAFVSWCAAAAGIPSTVIPRSAKAGYWRSAGTGTYTPIWSNGYTTYNAYKPQVGDFALYMPYCEVCGGHYNATSPSAHVVIVASVSSTQNADGSWTFTTIERGNGNTVQSNTVKTKDTRGSLGTCTCNDKQVPQGTYAYVVQGFWRPDWSLMGTTVLSNGSFDNITWKYDSDYNLVIEGSGDITQAPWRTASISPKNVVIGNGITGITCEMAFSMMNTINSVSIATSVKNIAKSAFYGCSNLKSIDIGEGIEEIGPYAFGGTSLSNLEIPRSVETIGEEAFNGCDFTSITLSSNLKSLGAKAFTGCKDLTDVTIEDGVSTIAERMFYGCTSLTNIYIPDSVEMVGKGAFANCTSLEEIVVDENNQFYYSDDGVLFDYAGPTLVAYPFGKASTYNVPNGVTCIAAEAFLGCTTLTSVNIPATVTNIGEYAFHNCLNLADIYLSVTEEEWTNNVTLGNYALRSTTTLHYLENIAGGEFDDITWTLDSSGKLTILGTGEMTDTPWSEYSSDIKSVVIGGNITSIADFAFEDCSQMTDCAITLSVESIGSGAFYGCSKLETIEIPESVTSVGDWAFRNCTSLTDVYLSVTEEEWANNVTLGSNAFPGTATFHYGLPELDFRILENTNGNVTFGWNYNGADQYKISINDADGNYVTDCDFYPSDAVDGKYEVTFALNEGGYKVYAIVVYPEVMTTAARLEFVVELDESDSYEVKNLLGTVSSGRFYADVEVVSKTARTAEDTIVIAVYKNNEMIDFVYMKADIPDNKSVHFGGMLEGSDGAVLKAFVWDSLQGMKNLSNEIEK